jgi:two-component system chemotaxis sensor kinase CheA
MDIVDAELIGEFVIESQEGLANIEQQMLAIEARGADVDLELVNAVFRTMHSIKGTAGFLGLDRIGVLAHRLEEVLNYMRNREIVPGSELVTTILQAADYMKGLIDAVETSNQADISIYEANLQRFRPDLAESADDVADDASGQDSTTAEATASANSLPLNDTVREFLIECHENLDQMERELVELESDASSSGLLRGIFRTMHTIKGGAGFLGVCTLEQLAHAAENVLGKLRDGALPLTAEVASALLATVDKCREGLRLLETQGTDAGFQPQDVIEQLLAADSAAADSRSQGKPATLAGSPVPASGSSGKSAGSAPTQKPNPPVAAAAPIPAAAASTSSLHASESPSEPSAPDKNLVPVGDSTIRVDVALLDKLMTRVGELVLARNQIVQFTSRLEDASFISTAQRLNLITTELQESVMKTRMQPIGNVWAKFPRVVRDLSSQLGKQVRIDMEGKETELDKTIVEAIKDPLTHLVRNSVDHGIETPEARRAAGKSAEGCLLLRAYHEGGQVNIEITDDGAGLNLDRIRKKAVERGLLSADQATRMSDRDAGQLIFAPGFSTAEKVTSVSGRGVGMDVVKTNIERISGTIDLQTRPGQGTTVKIKIPLTLAIIPALIVTNDGDRYAIPQVSLLELVRLDGAEAKQGIEYVHGAPVYRLRGKLLPLVYLSKRLGLSSERDGVEERAASEQIINIVVLRANDRQFGLVVDKVNDTEEIVVKPLSRQLKGLSEFAGATIMGDGTIALILDVMGLAVAAGLAGEMREQNHMAAAKSDGQGGRTVETLLVVDLGDTRRFALPTSMISRLEKLSKSSIEYADGREVIQYRGEIMPLVRLSEVFGAPQQNDDAQDELQIVVYADQEYRCGLIVHRIVDIVETELRFSKARAAEDNLLGTSVIQDHVTDVLNLRCLARRVATPKFIAK